MRVISEIETVGIGNCNDLPQDRLTKSTSDAEGPDRNDSIMKDNRMNTAIRTDNSIIGSLQRCEDRSPSPLPFGRLGETLNPSA